MRFDNRGTIHPFRQLTPLPLLPRKTLVKNLHSHSVFPGLTVYYHAFDQAALCTPSPYAFIHRVELETKKPISRRVMVKGESNQRVELCRDGRSHAAGIGFTARERLQNFRNSLIQRSAGERSRTSTAVCIGH